jgi:hypothetical protein
MNRFFSNLITFLVAVPCLATAARVQASGLMTLIKEGAEILSKRFGAAAAHDTAEGVAEQVAKEGAESVARRSAAKLVEESAEQVARRTGIIASRYTGDAARVALRYGEPAAGLINRFGDDAAQALVKVSTVNWRSTNNAAQRVLRGIAIVRHNWLFLGSDRGGRAAETRFSLIASPQRQ